jgi:hypothetical protein
LPDDLVSYLHPREHKLEKERDFKDFINSQFEDFYNAFENFDPVLASEMLEAKQKHIYREAGDHRHIVEALVNKTVTIREKIAGKASLRVPEEVTSKGKPKTSSDLGRSDRLKPKHKNSISVRPDSQEGSEDDDEDTSVDSLPESERVRLSQFIDKRSNAQLWRHEESFRKKTHLMIGTAFEKKKMQKEKVEELLPVIGGYMAKTANTLDIIARKSKLSFPDLAAKAAKETSQTSDRSTSKYGQIKIS